MKGAVATLVPRPVAPQVSRVHLCLHDHRAVERGAAPSRTSKAAPANTCARVSARSASTLPQNCFMACRLHPVSHAEPRFEARQATPPFVRARFLRKASARYVWRRFRLRRSSSNDECAGKAGCHRSRDGGPALSRATGGSGSWPLRNHRARRRAACRVRPRATDFVFLRQDRRRSLRHACRVHAEARYRPAPERARGSHRSRCEGRVHGFGRAACL